MVGLAALAGMFGALVGGNGVFVMYGIAGLAYTLLQACGVELPMFEDGVLNCFLLPCVIFNGACAAAGYAGYRGRMSGQDINHSLASLGSTTVLLVAAVGAVFGYVVVTLLNAIGFPADTVRGRHAAQRHRLSGGYRRGHGGGWRHRHPRAFRAQQERRHGRRPQRARNAQRRPDPARPRRSGRVVLDLPGGGGARMRGRGHGLRLRNGQHHARLLCDRSPPQPSSCC